MAANDGNYNGPGPAGSLAGVRTELDAANADIDGEVRLAMIADAGETTALRRDLGELDLALDGLGQLFAVENDRARLALERLEEDGADLIRLEGMQSERQGEVDIFDALRLDGSEEFHSNLLAWLLDPNGTHGLGGHFLQRFLAASGASRAIPAADRSSTAVRREKSLELDGGYGRLDIWIRNESANFVCAVENKVWATESGDQLAWYRRVLPRDYPDQRIHRVFLTRRGVPPDDPAEREHWLTISYTDILRLVEGTMAAAGDGANEDVLAFLGQYAITLRRNIVPEVSNDVHELARRIYRKHKRAIDLIIEHRERYEPNYVTEGFRMIRDAIGGQPLWKDTTSNHPYARFMAADWEEFDELKLDGWPYALLLFEIQVTERRATLTLLVAPGEDEELRSSIFHRVKDYLGTVHADQPAYTEDYVRLPTFGDILEPEDYDTWWDEERTAEIVAGRLAEFAKGEFAEIDRIVVECLDKRRGREQ